MKKGDLGAVVFVEKKWRALNEFVSVNKVRKRIEKEMIEEPEED